MLRELKWANLQKSGHWEAIFPNYCNTSNTLKQVISTLIRFLDMDETSLNAKHGIEGLSSFQSILANDLAYWDPFSLQVALMKHIFLNWDSLYARLNSHCKTWSYKKKSHKKNKAYRKSIQKEPTVNRCLSILDLKLYPKTRTNEASDGFMHLRET